MLVGDSFSTLAAVALLVGSSRSLTEAEAPPGLPWLPSGVGVGAGVNVCDSGGRCGAGADDSGE
eukprot:3871240-Karenia_brevis.AAC.1